MTSWAPDFDCVGLRACDAKRHPDNGRLRRQFLRNTDTRERVNDAAGLTPLPGGQRSNPVYCPSGRNIYRGCFPEGPVDTPLATLSLAESADAAALLDESPTVAPFMLELPAGLVIVGLV
jgi:hypothetical protein